MLKIPEDSDIVLTGQYTSAKVSVQVSCIKDHTWEVLPSNLNHKGTGKKCPVCAGKETELINGIYKVIKKKTAGKFKEEVKALAPNIEIIDEYTGASNYVTLKCLKHNSVWKSIATNVLTRERDRTCNDCVPKKPSLSVNDVQSKLPEYLTIKEYVDTSTPFIVEDSRCGHTTVIWYSNVVHKRMYRCSTCAPKTSNQERELRDFILANCQGEWIEFNDRSILDGKELDIVLPDRGLAIEYNGSYWHSDAKVESTYHIDKTNKVEAFGFRLLHIDEKYWMTKREIVESRIKQQLGQSRKIYARNTTLREIPFPREFLETNHLQGAGSASKYNYGLFLKDELVAVMTFSTPRFTVNHEYELVRYCSLLGTTVVGGASKLLKAFGRKDIVTYADRRFSDGNLYIKLGFTLSHTSPPGYSYSKSGRYLSRYQCQKAKLKTMFPKFYNDELSEAEIMNLAGYIKTYDAGNLVYVLK
jgi:very-short-patch-repair endonuclease